MRVCTCVCVCVYSYIDLNNVHKYIIFDFKILLKTMMCTFDSLALIQLARTRINIMRKART